MDYSYIFPDFTDKLEYVQVIYHNTNEAYQIRVSINDEQLIQTNAPQMPSLVADLVDLAASIYVADWLSPRKQLDRHHQIYIGLPLRNPDVFSDTKTMAHLQDLLQWYTGDDWYFEFKPRLKPGRFAESSRKLNLSYHSESVEVALWSGGLDSLAGLYNRLVEESSAQYTLFGTGSNDSMKGKQQEIAGAIKENFAHRIKLIQVPIEIRYPDLQKPPTNDVFRARGFVFKLLGSICAYLEGQQTLHIYENGFGAINLPYKLSEVGLDHTRSVHPLSLFKMGNFVSQLLNMPFACDNPFLFWTKAQMCKVLVKEKATDLACKTVTCDGRHRQAGQPSQCGYCSSCLLRRLALAVTQIEDRTEYVATHGTKAPGQLRNLHFEAMQTQVKLLQPILNSENAWRDIVQRYDDLRRIASCLAKQEQVEPEIIQNKLLQIYRDHVREWLHFQNTVQQVPNPSNEVTQPRQMSLIW